MRGVATTDLVARNLLLNGALVSDGEARLYAGQGVWRYSDGQLSPSASTGNGSLAIDASHLGAISAGRIFIIANEQGAGVRLDGRLSATASDISISSNGDIRLGQAHAARTVDVRTTGSVATPGSVLAGNDVLISADNVIQTGEMAAGNRIVVKAEGELLNSGDMAAGTELNLDADTGLLNQGLLYSAADLNVQSGYFFNSGLVYAGTDGIFSTLEDDFINQGVMHAGRDLHASAVTSLLNDNSGQLSSGRHLRLFAINELINTGTTYTNDTLGMTARYLNASGTQSSAGRINLRGLAVSLAGSTAAGGDILIVADDAIELAGEISTNQSFEAYSASFSNTANLSAGLNISIETGLFANAGIIEAAGRLELQAFESLNIGLLFGGNGHVWSEHFINAGVMAGQDDLVVAGHVLDNEHGQIFSNGSIALAIDEQLNNDGGLIAGSGPLSVSAEIIGNAGGQILSLSDAFFSSGTVDNSSDGVIAIGGNMEFQLQGGEPYLNNRGGSLEVGGDLLFLADGTVDSVTGTIMVGGNADMLFLPGANLLTSNGLLSVGGNAHLTFADYFLAGNAEEYDFQGNLTLDAKRYYQLAPASSMLVVTSP